jgi:hypothetical protein
MENSKNERFQLRTSFNLDFSGAMSNLRFIKHLFMKQLLTIVILLVAVGTAFSQSLVSRKGAYNYRNSVQVEILGSSNAYSINYEHILINRSRLKTGIRGGFGILPPFLGDSRIRYCFPILLNQQFSLGSHHIELGGGITMLNAFSFISEPIGYYFGSATAFGAMSLGYRYQRPEGRIIVKAAYTPLLRVTSGGYGSEFVQSVGLTVGYAF